MILLDTNVISEPQRREPKVRVLDWLDAQALETLYLSAITVAELRAGIALMPAGKRRDGLHENLEKGLSEIWRVLKPGGKLVVLEFSKPKSAVVKAMYNLYMKIICPNVGKIFSKNRNAYQYLDESIQHFPEGKNFTNILDNLGYTNTYTKPLSLGICSIYCGEKK